MTDQQSSSIAACWDVRCATLPDAASTSFIRAPTVGTESAARPRPLPANERKLRREVSGFILLFPFVNNLAIDDCHHTPRLENLELRDLHNVSGKNCQVGEFAGFDGATELFLKRSLGWPYGEHLQRLRACYRFLRMPAFSGEALLILARNGSIELNHWLAAF